MINSDWEMGIVMPDTHIPHQDDKALDLFLHFTKYYSSKLDYFVIIGDLIDCWEISKFDKVPKSSKEFAEEIEETKDLLKMIRKMIPNAKIVYIEGNHEFRFRKYIIERAPALYQLKGMDIGSLLGCEELGIEYIPSRPGITRFSHNDWKIGKLYIGHYDKVSKHAAYTAKNLLDDLGVSFIQGHTHRMGMTSRRLRDGTELVGVENGCLCDLNPNYVSFPNWQHGFSVFYKKKNDDRFQVYPIRMVKYKFFWSDIEWTYDNAIKGLYDIDNSSLEKDTR